MKVAGKMHATYRMLDGSETFTGLTRPLAVDSTSHQVSGHRQTVGRFSAESNMNRL